MITFLFTLAMIPFAVLAGLALILKIAFPALSLSYMIPAVFDAASKGFEKGYTQYNTKKYTFKPSKRYIARYDLTVITDKYGHMTTVPGRVR